MAFARPRPEVVDTRTRDTRLLKRETSKFFCYRNRLRSSLIRKFWISLAIQQRKELALNRGSGFTMPYQINVSCSLRHTEFMLTILLLPYRVFLFCLGSRFMAQMVDIFGNY